ncbi:noggin-3-like [Brienomyrus brachyistius]|uniref:noggin-3-like n=1 Tax=Brienomyrus brachyistius TaxID=42636 RepID=UPI0020B2981A|nr:noggin-3-like [Brienomyrus brachyistius]
MDLDFCVAVYVLALSFGFGMKETTCQHYDIFRPIPSDILPPVVLIEHPDPMFDPEEKDLNETELRNLLGSHFDSLFMSTTPLEDKHTSNGQVDSLEEVHLPNGSMPALIKSLEFDVLHGKKQSSRKLQRKLQLWLWTYASCPVVYAWNDLGRRFWPRYVKVGSCPRERSCSVPEGMVCKPDKSTHFTILRWRCQQKNAGLTCTWIHMKYPVVLECKCACAS